MNNATTSGPRVTPNLSAAWCGLWSLTWRRLFSPLRLMVALVFGAGLGTLSYLIARTGNLGAYSDWTSDFYLLLIVPLTAFLAGAEAAREDLKPGVVDYLITRPLPRWAYIPGKYFTRWLCLVPYTAVGLAILVGVGASLGIGGWGERATALLGAWLGGTSAFLALGFFCATLTSRYLVIGMAYAGLIEAGLGNMPLNVNRLSILRHLRDLVETDARLVPFLTLLGLSIALVALATGLFSRREFIGTKAQDE